MTNLNRAEKLAELIVVEKLNNLAKMEDEAHAATMVASEKVKSLIPEEVQAQTDAVWEEFRVGDGERTAKINRIKGEIAEAVLERGESVAGTEIRASFVKGRITWNTKGLEGFVLAHPELKELRREGKPTVRFTPIKKKEAGG